jgi:1-phosphofructokinase
VPADFYARLVGRLRGTGVRVAVDSSGPALMATLPAHPDVVKPNREELAEVTGRAVVTLGDALDAAVEVRRRGAGAALASLGPDGALLVEAAGAVHGAAAVAVPRSAVGAGDALLAGFLAGGGSGSGALVEALAWGAAAASLPGSQMPRPHQLDRDAVRLSPAIDAGRILTERS